MRARRERARSAAQHAWKVRAFRSVTRKHALQPLDPELPSRQLREQITKISRDGQVAAFEALLELESRETPVHLSAPYRPPEHEHGRPVPVVGAARSVLRDRATEFADRDEHHVLELLAEIDPKGAQRPAELL